jgi:hypothetical protein
MRGCSLSLFHPPLAIGKTVGLAFGGRVMIAVWPGRGLGFYIEALNNDWLGGILELAFSSFGTVEGTQDNMYM